MRLVKVPPWKHWTRKRLGSTKAASLSPLPLATLLAMGTAMGGTLWTLFLFFAAAVFGRGLALIPFLYGGVVQGHHW
ncbi:MAG TPA: hypothetical protein VFV38_04970 [Ktedonobacteraceae bacterium]|nr:hypothetical protein [Ktedonobacteraceae bacterium]